MDIQLLLLISKVFFLFFFPGFFVSLIFFKWKTIDVIERIVFSFGISLVLMAFVLFYVHVFGGVISSITILLVLAGIFLLTGIVLVIQHYAEKK